MSCYRKANGTQAISTSNVDGACSASTAAGAFSPCCPIKSNVLGSGNLCLSSFLCWESAPPVGGTGFLTASCTDSSYQSGECNQHCADNPVPDITYNNATGLWACCSWTYEGGVDCSHPTDETFSAPAPEVLLAAASSASSIYPSSVATRSTTGAVSTGASTVTPTSSVSSTGPSPSATTTQSSKSGLSTGAEAGIGVGIAIGVIALVILAFLFGRRQRRQRHPAPEAYRLGPSTQGYTDVKPFHKQNTYDAPPPTEMYSHQLHEASGDSLRGNRREPYELD